MDVVKSNCRIEKMPHSIEISKRSSQTSVYKLIGDLWFKMMPEPYGTYCIATIVVVTSLVYVAMNDAVLSVFTCTRILDRMFLTKAMDIDCESDMHTSMQSSLGVAGLVLYSLGIPATFAWIVWQERWNFQRNNHIAHYRYAFLVSGYRETTRFWESIIMLQKFALAVIGRVMSAYGVEASVLAGFFFFLSVWYTHETFLPFANKRLNELVRLSLFTVCTTYLGCIVMMTNTRSYRAEVLVSTSIISLNIVFLTRIVWLMTRSFDRSHLSIRSFVQRLKRQVKQSEP